jgi:hypothetical protein
MLVLFFIREFSSKMFFCSMVFIGTIIISGLLLTLVAAVCFDDCLEQARLKCHLRKEKREGGKLL